MSSENHVFNHALLLETQSPNFTIAQASEIASALYGLTGSLSPLDSELDQNFLLEVPTGEQFVLKIYNRASDPAILQMQTAALQHIAMVDPGLPVPRVIHSIKGLAIEQVPASDGLRNYVQILTYMPGVYPQDDPFDYKLLRQIGACLAWLGRALRGFHHPAADYELLWDIKQAANLKAYLHHVANPDHHQLASHFLERFKQNVLPKIPKLRAQVVHNDFAPNNIVVAGDDPKQIVGILDFGDVIYSPLIADLATSIAQIILEQDDPVGAAAQVIASYHEIIPLETDELSLLYDLIATRLTMLCVIATWRVTLFPENRAYIMGSVDELWEMLEIWKALDPQFVTTRFLRTCGFWEKGDFTPSPKPRAESRQAKLDRRARLLGPNAYLFYDEPLHILRGEGVWLYDDAGNRYLDVYNNVPHVGHCHPHVVKAIADQARRLNTSTRYLHDLILELAHQITSRMPEPLSVCTFVCTGTEANELAWRMSKLVSGEQGALVTNHSYHGNSDAIIEFSTEEIPPSKIPSHVATIFPPSSNSAYHEPDSGLAGAIAKLSKRGYHPAMLLLDSGFTSDGIFTSPGGYLERLYAETRRAGGLCVADEVQVGFGRFGAHFWGFEFNDVVPDIVTMGKPMGNGHPIAAVVTRPDIAQALADETGYFNTYGGNPVSCAAGLAVLDVIEMEGLQKTAHEIGRFLVERLQALRVDHPVLGEPHGSGLLLGVDIHKPDGSPDPDLANRIMNHMRHDGVLIGTTGQNVNVLKIRPPMVFNREHAEILLAAVQKALQECL